MTKIDQIARLKDVIKQSHKCESRHVESIEVQETFNGQTIWRGTIQIFDLENHPQALRCYAWSSFLESGGKNEQFFTVLQLPPIVTAADAVRSVIAKEPNFKLEAGRVYKVMCFALDDGRNVVLEIDLILEEDKPFFVMEWMNIGGPEIPSAKLEIDPHYLQKLPSGQRCDFFYRGQIAIPKS